LELEACSTIEMRTQAINGAISRWTTIPGRLSMRFVKQEQPNTTKDRLNTWPTIV
jgi:hypothetical protein